MTHTSFLLLAVIIQLDRAWEDLQRGIVENPEIQVCKACRISEGTQVNSRSAYESLQAVPQVQELQQEYFDPQQQWGPSKEMLASCAALPLESMSLTLVTWPKPLWLFHVAKDAAPVSSAEANDCLCCYEWINCFPRSFFVFLNPQWVFKPCL